MRLTQSIAAALLVSGSVAASFSLSQASYAQSADTDEEDADPAEADDDADVPDPDDPANDVTETDSAEPDDPGSEDPGAGSDAVDVERDDDGGSAAPGSDDGGDDDGGSAASGSSDDDGDDDGAAASGTADDDGDDDGPSGPTNSAAADDDGGPGANEADEDSDGEGNAELPNGDEGGDDSPVEVIGGGEESETERLALDEKEGIETDREGFRYRRNEFVALDLDTRDIAALRTKGFTILQTEPLTTAGGTVHLVKGPLQMSDQDAFALLDDIADPGSLSFNHLFDSSSGEIRKVRNRTAVSRIACGCEIGMIDTGVAARLPMFKHVVLEQRAFNAKVPAPRLHGTAVAHQFAGTEAKLGRPTKIVIADIFSGQRASSGSTFALVRALDWLATRGIPVINVSLTGPRNPVVAGTVDRLVRRGHIIVAAAGNDGPAAPPVFPGAYSGVVAVTAVDDRQQVYRYANRGPYIAYSAFGVSVPAINPKGESTVATGTSFAAPAVAARLARESFRPDPAARTSLLARLEREARDLGAPGRDSVFGHGLVVDAR